MKVEVKSKDELQSIVERLKNTSSQLTSEAANLISNLLEIEDFDEIKVTPSSLTIQGNLKNISRKAEAESSRLINYFNDIKNLDTYDFEKDKQDISLDRVENTNTYSNKESSNTVSINQSKNKTEFGENGKFKII